MDKSELSSAYFSSQFVKSRAIQLSTVHFIPVNLVCGILCCSMKKSTPED
jgi:hypothetical protein